MSATTEQQATFWTRLGLWLMPFADVTSEQLPLTRLFRLSLFQISVGIAVVLLTGTLNRVMVVELGIPASLVALMVALPLVFAPLRALIGFRSDDHRSPLGWKRLPYLWFGTLLQFGGLAIMPFALLVMSGDTHGPLIYGQLGAGLAFLLVGAGMHTTQTAGLSLATDLAAPEQRPRLVAFLFAMLLVGMFIASVAFGFLLMDFTQIRLIRVVQGAAVCTFLLNCIAMWKQEVRNPAATSPDRPRRAFLPALNTLLRYRRARRLLIAVALGSVGFAMQDVLLEPYGGEVLGLSVAATTSLTAIFVGGTFLALMLASRVLRAGMDTHRLAAYGALVGAVAFALMTLVGGTGSVTMFRIGAGLIGFGAGLFAVGTLVSTMDLARDMGNGLALGAWGAVQATATGVAIALGGAARDGIGALTQSGALGEVLASPATGYSAVYQMEVIFLFMTMVVIGPLARHAARPGDVRESVELARFPT